MTVSAFPIVFIHSGALGTGASAVNPLKEPTMPIDPSNLADGAHLGQAAESRVQTDGQLRRESILSGDQCALDEALEAINPVECARQDEGASGESMSAKAR